MAAAQHELCVLVRVYNESDWLLEWIEFYRLQGATLIWVYDDASDDQGATDRLLAPYVDAGVVRVTRWDHRRDDAGLGDPSLITEGQRWRGVNAADPPQTAPFRHALRQLQASGEARWLLLVDADEFAHVVQPAGAQPLVRLLDVLPQLERYAGVGINWQCFGTNGVHEKAAGATSLDTFTRCDPATQPTRATLPHSMGAYVKCLVQVARVQDVATSHVAVAHAGDAYGVVDSGGARIADGSWWFGTDGSASYDQLRIAHYWTRDERWARERKQDMGVRFGFSLFRDNPARYWRTVATMNVVRSDASVECWAPALRARIAAWSETAIADAPVASSPSAVPVVLALLDWRWYAERYVVAGAQVDVERHWLAVGKATGYAPNYAVERHRTALRSLLVPEPVATEQQHEQPRPHSNNSTGDDDGSLWALVRVYNEGAWLREWLEFHRMQGVAHFLVYDDGSDDGGETARVLAPYVDAGLAERIAWDHRAPDAGLGDVVNPFATDIVRMLSPLHHALQRLQRSGEARWLLMIDADEFVYPACAPSRLVDVLPQLERYAAVHINWRRFGTNGVAEKPADVTSLDAFTRCAAALDNECKPLVQVRRVRARTHSPHYATPLDGEAASDMPDRVDGTYAYVVDTDGVRMTRGPFPPKTGLSAGTLRLNHYFTRDRRFMRERKQASHARAGFTPPSDAELTAIDAATNAVRSDGAIERFADELRSRLAAPFDAAPAYVAAPSAAAPLPMLDWHWYVERYADLPNVGMTSRQAAETHWRSWGRAERRHPNAIAEAIAADGFDWRYYTTTHASLLGERVARSMDACAKHWLGDGKRAGLLCKPPV